jgi:hypothetical protein
MNTPPNLIEANVAHEIRALALELQTFANDALSAIDNADNGVLENILTQRNSRIHRIQELAHSYPQLLKVSPELLEAAHREDEVLRLATLQGEALKSELENTQQVIEIRSAYGNE